MKISFRRKKGFYKAQLFFNLLRLLLLIFLLNSCTKAEHHSYSYPNQKEVSDPLGLPISSHTWYYPVEIDQQKTGIDSLQTLWKSFRLRLMNEPILYNSYLNTDLFRLTVFPSFSPIKTFKFYKQGNDVYVTVKTLHEKESRFPKNPNIKVNEDSEIDVIKGPEGEKFPEFNSNTLILKNKWNELTEHVNKIHFLNIPNKSDHMGLDGTIFILEQHTKDHYWFVDRWSPCMSPFEKNNLDCDFESLCNYLLTLAKVEKR